MSGWISSATTGEHLKVVHGWLPSRPGGWQCGCYLAGVGRPLRHARRSKGGWIVGVSYADAVRLLGGPGSRVVAALDRLTGGLLLAAAAAGSGFAFSLFEARAEFLQLSGELITGLEARMRGLDRFSRSERLAAAHAVIVVTSFFDALESASLPFDARLLELTASEQVTLAGGNDPSSGRLRALAAALLRAEVPMPVPQRPYEDTIEALRGYYEDLSGDLLRFVSGLAVFERLDTARREQFATTVTHVVPGGAVVRYEEFFRRLAVDFPEMAFWANAVDHQVMRMQLLQVRRGLQDLELVLSRVAAGRAPDERRASLWRAYRAALGRSALPEGSAPRGLSVPPIDASYVNPDFRVAAPSAAERFGEESWWADKPLFDDLAAFLADRGTAW
jgi:NACHT conflict system protein